MSVTFLGRAAVLKENIAGCIKNFEGVLGVIGLIPVRTESLCHGEGQVDPDKTLVITGDIIFECFPVLFLGLVVTMILVCDVSVVVVRDIGLDEVAVLEQIVVNAVVALFHLFDYVLVVEIIETLSGTEEEDQGV